MIDNEYSPILHYFQFYDHLCGSGSFSLERNVIFSDYLKKDAERALDDIFSSIETAKTL